MMRKTYRFKLFGYYVAISRSPFRTKAPDKTCHIRRSETKNKRLKLAGNRCEICGKPIDKRCALHHLLNVGEPNRNTVENVMVLCSACHHELEKRPHFHGIRHLEDNTRYDTDRKPDYQEPHEETNPR